jgi:hypothetical protein
VFSKQFPIVKSDIEVPTNIHSFDEEYKGLGWFPSFGFLMILLDSF